MSINLNTLKQTLLHTFHDADINIVDETGDGKHLFLHIISDCFKNLSSIERHKLIYSTLKDYMQYIHALSIKAETILENK